MIYKNPKEILKNNKLLPILYNENSNIISIEHIYPKCFLNKDHFSDFHNTFRSSKKINNLRSNYMFSDLKNITWIHIHDNNYISHKYKLFNPRDCDKGIIARAMLYMTYQYNYKILMDKRILYNWCMNYKPTIHENLHNFNGKKIQGNFNPFISKFYDKDYDYFVNQIINK
jgi:endonuclease I